MRISIILCILLCSFINLLSQNCASDENILVVKISTDRFGQETSWLLSSADSIYGGVERNVYNGGEVDIDTFCIPQQACITFTIYDGFGDGIVDGGYELFLNGDSLAAKSEFGKSESVEIACVSGTSCSKAIAITQGIYQTSFRHSWYIFTPDSIGTYEISTCEGNDCDTQIWVYDRCESVLPQDNEGFIFFNEDACGKQAKVNALLDAGESYLIRISVKENSCANQDISWSLTYNGPIVGCMDATSCNYNPLATEEDGSCIPQGDPNCPGGPDLRIREDILLASLVVDTIEYNDEKACLVNEGCLKGVGTREVIRFTTRFENIGEQDYYIGSPSTETNQFTFDNCHNHFHYDNYAEYLLYNEQGERLPAGFKSGFCVVDLMCTSGNNKYGCNNMGLTVGCADEYGSDLDCQWIDVTDYPDGNYLFVARVNWGNQPDLIGRVEKDLSNNWSQACLILDRSSGKLEATVSTDCPVFVDCEGTAYGTVEKDCNGVCGGTTMMGDIDNNVQQDMQDVDAYINSILDGETTASPCNDLNRDEVITIYDAALLADCISFGTNHAHPTEGLHDHCNFPAGIYNSIDTVSLTISDFDATNKTIDLAIQNTSAAVVAYQFKMQGIRIQSVESLIDKESFPISIKSSIKEAQVLGLSTGGATIERSRAYQPFVRIYYLELTEPLVCLETITDIVNENYQQVVTRITGDCLETQTTSTKVVNIPKVQVKPNPFTANTLLVFPNPNQALFTLRVYDSAGRLQTYYTGIKGNRFEWNRNNLENGVYFFQLVSEEAVLTGKLVLK